MMNQAWRIELLGGLRAYLDNKTHFRLPTRKMGALLAYLILHSSHSAPREELLALLWPEEEPEVAKNRLRVMLTSLRYHLEPPGTKRGLILQSNRLSVSLHPHAFTSDVLDMLYKIKWADNAPNEQECIAALKEAVALYKGELLPGNEEEWVLAQRQYLSEVYYHTLRKLTTLLKQNRDFQQAIEYAQKAVYAEPLDEEAHYELIQLYSLTAQPSTALRHYQQLEALFRQELGAAPSPKVKALAQQLQAQLGHLGNKKQTAQNVLPILIATEVPKSPQQRQSIPPRLTRFFGREEELEWIQQHLVPSSHQYRLISLLGTGGIGKTRLAIEAAERVQDCFGGGVWFIPFASLSNSALIGDEIMDALDISQGHHQEPLEHLIQAMEAKGDCLLILDNIEHLLPEAAATIQHLLERLPHLCCLVTSRKRLGIRGDRELWLKPLPTPSANMGLNELLQCPSVALFIDRLQSHNRKFLLNERNRNDVAWICQWIEGHPLAIELVSSHAQMLSPAQMRAQFTHRLNWTVDTSSLEKGDRQGSLQRVLDTSYHLLPIRLRKLFASLSVFQGGWDAEAACKVCFDGESLLETMQALETLRTNSLIEVEQEGETRYRMLEVIREYAARYLRDEERNRLCDLHYHFFFQKVLSGQQSESELHRREWLSYLKTNDANVRAALDWCFAKEPQKGAIFAEALTLYWMVRGAYKEGRSWLSKALACYPQRDLTYAKALNGLGWLSFDAGDYATARTCLEECCVLFEQLGNKAYLASALRQCAQLAWVNGDLTKAWMLLQQAWDVHGSIGTQDRACGVLGMMGIVSLERGDLQAARTYLQQSAHKLRELGDRVLGFALGNLGIVELYLGNYQEAAALQQEALEHFQKWEDVGGIAFILLNLGRLARLQQNCEDAHALCQQSLTLARQTQETRAIAYALHELSAIALEQAQMDAAQAYLEEAIQLACRSEERALLPMLYTLKAKLLHSTKAEFTAVIPPLQEALTLLTLAPNAILLVEALATAALCLPPHDDLEAARLWGALEHHQDTTGLVLDPTKQRARSENITQRKRRHTEADWEECYAQGKEMALLDAGHHALKLLQSHD
ncbi:DNA-binding transcriptional activator of the SARP family [Chthonomonas calidirosea]|uniref:DNA-binding transcriptional activator of the SARP family n=1 Tax=Chthonomonas calidirosea (strain DSM 23976 / ICMP 18418 / T49) TaxID=1303518 RepID=S0EXZ5_CHTCT|nr:tetratricopeptide repeat protein [Chthonomonas calidirosea]CCW36579.1 DNA-binding transcriptional activator of the SARP family [Chthonomonas calidirosea T49]CEK16911.1 DNA-binding transcriptional activator of the SARP family [Chthonomonas calidirosea]